jgi:hypothetical protein
MNMLNSLRKKSLYLIGSLLALIATYVIASDTYTVSVDSPQVLPSKVYADLPSSGDNNADDCGDVGDGSCQ